MFIPIHEYTHIYNISIYGVYLYTCIYIYIYVGMCEDIQGMFILLFISNIDIHIHVCVSLKVYTGSYT